jgi:hypothetical protein
MGVEDDEDEGAFVPHVSFRQPVGSNRYVALCRHCGEQAHAPHQMDVIERVAVLTRFLDDHRECSPPLPDA